MKGYTDANIEGNPDDKKSTLGYLFTFVGEIYHGSKKCKSVLPYLQLRLSILQRMKQYIEMISPRSGFEAS